MILAFLQLLITLESRGCQHDRSDVLSWRGFPTQGNCVRYFHVPARWPAASVAVVASNLGRSRLTHRIGAPATQHLQNHEAMERHRIHKTGAGRDAVGSFVHPADTKFNRGGDISQIDD
jgi:hypothetical protein